MHQGVGCDSLFAGPTDLRETFENALEGEP